MIGKFLAILFSFLFGVIFIPLVLVQSITGSFLSEEKVLKKIVPLTYHAVTTLAVEQISEDPDTRALFASRLRTAIPEKIYADIIGAALRPFLKPETDFRNADFRDLKTRFKARIPEILKNLPSCGPTESNEKEFRFCKEKNVPEQEFLRFAETAIEKELPDRVNFAPGYEYEVVQVQYIRRLIQGYLPHAIVVLSAVFLSIIALLLFSKPAILSWFSRIFFSFSLSLALTGIFLYKIPNIAPAFQEFSPGARELGEILIRVPLPFLMQAGLFLFFASVILFILKRDFIPHKK